MHHALQVSEILSIIFDYLVFPLTPDRRRSALAALARTCQAFKEVALDALWSELSGPSPIVQCLPENFWKRSDSRIFPKYSFTRPLTETEWNTIQGYARRVRVLTCSYFSEFADEATITTLSHPPVLAPRPLFPNLQRLEWKSDSRQFFRFISHVIGPQLTCLELDWGTSWDIGELAILASFRKRCPDLKEVFINVPTHDNSVHLSGVLSEALRGWNGLRSVRCGPINGSALLHLGQLQTLQELIFFIDPLVLHGLSEDLTTSFGHLDSLVTESKQLTTSDQMLLRLRISPEKLGVDFDDFPTHSAVRSYFTTLTATCDHVHLRDLTMQWTGNVTSPVSQTHILTFQDLSPLKSFGNLTKIRIETGCPISLSSEDLLDLASAWPHLACLSLNERSGWRTSPRVTPHVLAQLARQCTRLFSLDLAIDTAHFDSVLEDRPSFGYTNSSLHALDVLDSPIENLSVTPLAAFLSDIFPNLDSVFSWCSDILEDQPETTAYRERWSSVQNQLVQIRQVREQERRWWLGRTKVEDTVAPQELTSGNSAYA